ncbi:MAG: hypothetical protein KIT22_10870, partial [Verrucomicrobiae bacterium]|nr:hypothetical protein [Verrucomicrobiae bacterium]
EPAPPSGPAEMPLTEAELRELLSLRRDVGRLRRENPRLVALQAENTRLKAAVAEAASATNRVPVPEGYLMASQARFLGQATPADALQSFLWSIRNRDTNALFQVLTPDSAEVQLRGDVDQFLESARVLPGFFIKSVEENADGTAVAKLQFHPHDPESVQELSLERDEQGAWRLQMR